MKISKISSFIKNEYFVVFSLFICISLLYYLCNIYHLINIKVLVLFLILTLAFIYGYSFIKKKLTSNQIIFTLLILGILLRVYYAFSTDIFSRQHDVGLAYEDGHYGYALYIFRNNSLPNTNISQFYQPPLNAFLQAFWMRINSLFIPLDNNLKKIYLDIFNNQLIFQYNNELIAYLNSLYSTCRILSCFYSCLTLLIVYKFLKEFDIKNKTFIIILLLIVTQPVLIMFSGAMNNDNLSYLFFFSALLFAIKWYKNPTYKYIIAMSLSIGLGMITKLSIGFIAIIIGPIMIIKFIEYIKNKKYKIIYQFTCFSLIVFPLGLSYAFRNYFLFDQNFTYILDFGRDSWLHEVIKEKNIFERFLSLPIKQLYHHERGIFHDYQEYNIWVDLIKTSIFGEFSYPIRGLVLGNVMYVIAICCWLLLFPFIIYIIYRIKNKTYRSNVLLTILSISLVILAFISYISFCIKMPYSCSSNFRYIAYISLAMSIIYAFYLENTNNKLIYNVIYFSLIIFAITSSFFIIII